MKELENIYYNIDKLMDGYVDSPETEESYKKVDDFIKYKSAFGNVGNDTRREELSDLIAVCMAENEKQGFMYGFRYAVALLTGGTA